MTPKIWVTKEKIDKLYVIKFKTLVLQKTSSKNESKYFQIKYLIKRLESTVYEVNNKSIIRGQINNKRTNGPI